LTEEKTFLVSPKFLPRNYAYAMKCFRNCAEEHKASIERDCTLPNIFPGRNYQPGTL